jgi:DNA-binding transcriptional ArsR family regulator
MKPSELQDVAEVCHMLGDPNRVSIVAALAKGARTVGALRDDLKVPLPTISHHLSLLCMWRLVDRKREGRKMRCSLNRERLETVRDFLANLK